MYFFSKHLKHSQNRADIEFVAAIWDGCFFFETFDAHFDTKTSSVFEFVS